LGIVPAIRVQGVLDALNAGDTIAILDHCQALSSLGADWISFWRELMLAFRDRLEAEARIDSSPPKMLRSARILQLLLQRERDLRDSSLPQVVVELALLTAAQLPHLAPLDGLVSSTLVAPAPRLSAQALTGTNQSASPVPVAPRSVATPASPPETPLPDVDTTILEFPKITARRINPISNPDNMDALRGGVSDVLKSCPGGLPRTLASLPHMAADLRWESPILRWCFPNNVRNTVQELERERTNPYLLAALASLLPGLTGIEIIFDESSAEHPEDLLRREPAFQALLQASGGEILEVKRESV